MKARAKFMIGKGINKDVGETYLCHCPFHKSDRAALFVDSISQLYTCLVCEATGEVGNIIFLRANPHFGVIYGN